MEKENVYCFIAGAAVSLLAVFVFSFCSGRGDGTDPQVTINTLAEQNAGAGASVTDSQKQLDGIGAGIAETESQLGVYADSAERIAEKSRDSKQLIERCIRLNQEATQLLRDIEQRNKEPAKEIKDKPG